MRRSRVLTLVGIAAAIALWFGSALPASARWAYGNGPADLDVIENGAAGQFGVNQVCANRIKGRAGASGPGDFATYADYPSGAVYGTRTVEIFASSTRDFNSGSSVPGGIDFGDVVLPPVVTVTTSALAKLSPFGTYDDFSGNTFTVYAGASFNVVPPANKVHVGDFIAVRVKGHNAFYTNTASACAVTPK